MTTVALALCIAEPGMAVAAGKPAATDSLIAVVDQASRRILLLDQRPDAWRAARITWQWQPTLTGGFGDLLPGWGRPDEVKLRFHDEQGYLLVTDSFGLAALVPYPQGRGGWAVNAGPDVNPHSAELLPDGNVAVVASTGGWLRVYTASAGARSLTYAQFPLAGAHGVVWDSGLLWGLGRTELVALRVGGTSAAPTLTEDRRVALPVPGGHDLYPVAGSPGRLWVSTGSRVYQYVLDRQEFVSDYPQAQTVDGAGVKAISDHPDTGQILISARQGGNLCVYCTDTIALVAPQAERVLHGAQIYKSRWWIDPAVSTRR